MSSLSAFSTLSLVGKVAVVTGATSGIGADAAKVLGLRGASVVVSGRRADKGAAVVAEIKKVGGEAFFIQADASIEADIKRLIEGAVKKYGRIDIAFNNAGFLDTSATAPLTTSNDSFNRTIDVNLRGVHWCMKYEIEQFLRQREAAGITGETQYNGAELISPNRLYLTSHPYSIINNASVYGLVGSDYGYVYNATKFAVIGLTRSAALNYAKFGIRINAVCPGYTHSEITEKFPVKILMDNTPMGRVAQSAEIAEAVAFLASASASLITGIALPVDGGFMA